MRPVEISDDYVAAVARAITEVADEWPLILSVELFAREHRRILDAFATRWDELPSLLDEFPHIRFLDAQAEAGYRYHVLGRLRNDDVVELLDFERITWIWPDLLS